MAAILYTPEVLALATDLAAWPWDETLPLHGEARSQNCGSALRMGLAIDTAGRVERLALKPQACAIGQAAAAIFARGALGRNAGEIAASQAAIEAWLTEGQALPDWPGLSVIAAARDYPARHGAILLPWRAATAALR